MILKKDMIITNVEKTETYPKGLKLSMAEMAMAIKKENDKKTPLA